MSHFTHICKCGHARENHGRGSAGEPCATSKVIPCGCIMNIGSGGIAACACESCVASFAAVPR
jgi:hypothetical protein